MVSPTPPLPLAGKPSGRPCQSARSARSEHHWMASSAEPESRRRRQTLHVDTSSKNRATTQATNPRNDRCGDTRRIDGDQVFFCVALEVHEVRGDQHERRRCKRHDKMRSQASGATVHVALIANDRSKHRAPNHASQEVYLQDYHLPDESRPLGSRGWGHGAWSDHWL